MHVTYGTCSWLEQLRGLQDIQKKWWPLASGAPGERGIAIDWV